jgi:hypothetical protein
MEHDNEQWLLDKLWKQNYITIKFFALPFGTLEGCRGVGALLNEDTYQRLIFLLTPDLQKGNYSGYFFPD